MSDRPLAVDRTDDLFEILRGGEARGAALADTLWRYMPIVPRTLEVGVGAGVVASAVGADGRWVAGIDLSPLRLRRAFRRLLGAAACADAAALPFPDGAFDAAYLVWLQIVPAPALVAEVARVLRPGARLVVVAGRHAVAPDDDVGAVEARLEGLHPWRERPADVALQAAGAGLRLVARAHWVIAVDQAPEDAARGIERRDLATLWGLDPDEAAAASDDAVAALRALPAPERPRRRTLSYPLLAFERDNHSWC